MKENIRKEIRTCNERIKIGEVIYIDKVPQILVRHNKKIDIITLDEIVSQLYGESVTFKNNKGIF